MEKNIGVLDKSVRIILGIVMLVAGLIFQSWWWLLGLAPLLTGILGYCPLYTLMGFNTGGGYVPDVGYYDQSAKLGKPGDRLSM